MPGERVGRKGQRVLEKMAKTGPISEGPQLLSHTHTQTHTYKHCYTMINIPSFSLTTLTILEEGEEGWGEEGWGGEERDYWMQLFECLRSDPD